MARDGGNSISAAGSTRFVAGAIIGNAVGNAFKANADFNDCMQASGFLIADNAARADGPPAGLVPSSPQPAVPFPVTAQPLAVLPRSTEPVMTPAPTHELFPEQAMFVVPSRLPQPLASEVDDLKACEFDLRHNEFFDPIASHLPNANGKYSFTQIADPASPTPDERKVFATYIDTTRKCVDHLAQYLQYNSPALAPLLSRARDDQDAHLLALVSGHSTWGEYAQHDTKTRAFLASTFSTDIEP